MKTTHPPTLDTTVGELVTQRPGRSRVFEKLGIDYCCGGKKPLAEACKNKGLDADTVLSMLLAMEEDTSGQKEDWTDLSLTELTTHIENTHHDYLKRELPRLGAMVRKVAAVHGSYYPWMLEVDGIYAGFAAEMESHMLKEEQILFPLIRRIDSGDAGSAGDCGPGIANPIRVMEHEHDDAGQALSRMRELTNAFTPPMDACNTFRAMLDGLAELEADTHRHVHKENNVLFPVALEKEKQTA
jgi:regulator of cell morphogenesis and NO signaling